MLAPKPPLILLPGLLNTADLWRHQMDNMDDIADIRIGDLTRHNTMSGMAEMILDKAPPRFSLAGLSMGGYVALEILRRAPRRVERLALVNTSARSDDQETQLRRQGLIAQIGQGEFKGITGRLLPLLVHEERQRDEAFVDHLQAMALAVGPDAYIRQQQAILGRCDGREALRAVRCPALVIGGVHDKLTPPHLAEEMAALIPGAKLVIFDDCGHLAPLEAPEATTAAMRAWMLTPTVSASPTS